MAGKGGRKPIASRMKRTGIILNGDTWDKLGWLADEKGTTRSDIMRLILNAGTQHARPPVRWEEKVVAVTDEEWGAWRDAAAQVGKPLDQLIREQMNAVVKAVFRKG